MSRVQYTVRGTLIWSMAETAKDLFITDASRAAGCLWNFGICILVALLI